ncbi:hypothetical protein Thermo_02058 [Thermoplasmatales archaeon]|nr:hypothetical protein Thermo_02058 [Thermoplasmatales archaeon]
MPEFTLSMNDLVVKKATINVDQVMKDDSTEDQKNSPKRGSKSLYTTRSGIMRINSLQDIPSGVHLSILGRA